MKKMIFIYNPNAGKGCLKSSLSNVFDIFVKEGYEVVAYPTQARMDAYEKVKSLEDEYDLLVCSGGDGTLDEVVTGMMERENKIPMGYIPTGTTNDFASSLNISKNISKAAKDAVTGKVFKCDVGTFNDDIFVYVAAFGLFTDVPYETGQSLKKVLGHAAYVIEGGKRLFKIPSYHVKVTHDGEVIEDDVMIGMVSNSNSVAGFKGITGKTVSYDDGLFEVVLIKKPKNLVQMFNIARAMLSGKFNSPLIYSFKAKELSFECEQEISWTLDGEFGGKHENVVIKNEQQVIEIMLGYTEKKEGKK